MFATSDRVPDNCPLSPWEEDYTQYCPSCGKRMVEGSPHAGCWK